MNSTIFLSTVAILGTALLQPLEAKPKENKGGGKKHAAAAQQAQKTAPPSHAKSHAAPQQVAKHSKGSSKQFAQHSKGASKKFAQHSQPAPQQFRQQAQSSSSVAMQSGKGNGKARKEARKQQTIAFGGARQGNVDRDVNVQSNRQVDRDVTIDNRRYGGNQYIRNDYRQYRPPTYVYRDWDRGHVHRWNNHSYRWHNNDWVIIDLGLGYGYDSPNYYDSGPVVGYSTSGNSALAVQEELSRRGYDPGVIDGVIGPQTRSAIAAYQQDRGLPVTGRIDTPLLRDMGL